MIRDYYGEDDVSVAGELHFGNGRGGIKGEKPKGEMLMLPVAAGTGA